MQRVSNVGFLRTKVNKAPNKKVARPTLSNSLLKIKTIHAGDPSIGQLYRNARGIADRSLQSTISHAPSLYYWLSTRCGIAMNEAQRLVEDRRILVDGAPVATASALEDQSYWHDVAARDIRIVLEDGAQVPALHRARHRTYKLLYFARSMSMSHMEHDPLSYLHAARLPPGCDTNLLYAPGFAKGMEGLTIATNDSSALPQLWNNHELGISAQFDVELRAGVPAEIVSSLAKLAEDYATKRFAPNADLGITPSVTVEHRQKQAGASVIPNVPHIVVEAPLLPHKLFRTMMPQIKSVVVRRLGPFVLPSAMKPRESRRLEPHELEALFTFERKLKTNRLVRSLREVSEAEPSGDQAV